MSPKVVIGVPLYNNAGHIPEALESLLSQTFRDYALVLVDDCSTDSTPKIVRQYERLDERITSVRNEERLGMVLNWRKAFELSRERHPDMQYFAWASDHDVWHPRWLSALVAVLDAEPDVVMTYPLNVGIDDEGRVIRDPWKFDTLGITDARERLALTSENMTAGNMVYSLFRADALASCGVYRLLLLPDRLLMTELALHGQFKQVPEVLWHRRYNPDVKPSLVRQRVSFFPNGAPGYSFLPWSLLHSAAIAQRIVLRGDRPPGIGRGQGIGFSLWYLRIAVRFQVFRWARKRRKDARRLLLKRVLPSFGSLIGGERSRPVLSKAASRASKAAGDDERSRSERARELVGVAGETVGELRRGRRASAAKESKQKRHALKPAKEAGAQKPAKDARAKDAKAKEAKAKAKAAKAKA